MKRLILMSCACAMLSMNVEAGGKLLKRVKQQADVVGSAYGETWNTFYGDGHYKNLMTAALDTRPDGTPNIVLDEAAGKMEVTIRLSVNEANYNAWKEATHKRFKDANMSYSFSDFEDTQGRMIGGKNYRFGENEEKSIQRWESVTEHRKKADLIVWVRAVDDKGKVIREDYLPINKFERLGFATFPLPLHNLNRLGDLSAKRFHWFDTEKQPEADTHVESAYVKLVYDRLSKTDMDSLDEVKCEILDGDESQKYREKEYAKVMEKRRREEAAAEEARRRKEIVDLSNAVRSRGLTSIEIPAGVPVIYELAFRECESLKSITIPISVRSIGDGAFFYCSGLTSVKIPSNVTNIGESAFSGCSRMTSVTIPASVTSIGDSAFYGCNSLKTIYVAPGDGTRMKELLSSTGERMEGVKIEETKLQ